MKLGTVKVALALAFGTAAVLLGAGAAGATTVVNPPFTLSDRSFGTGFGVHFDGTQTGNTINAHVNIDGSAVTFSSDDTLSVVGSGEATLNGPFDDLDVVFAKSWAAVTFAFDVPNKTTADMSIFINGSATPTFFPGNCSICTLTSMGEQKFTVTGPDIDQLQFQFSENIDDAKQFRVASAVPPIPEPSTWAMLIVGVGLIGFAARRRSAGLALAA